MPVAVSELGGAAGMAFWPSTTSLAMPPYRARIAKPGTGAIAGRCSARPSALENSRLVTGSGAVALNGPLQRSSSIAAR